METNENHYMLNYYLGIGLITSIVVAVPPKSHSTETLFTWGLSIKGVVAAWAWLHGLWHGWWHRWLHHRIISTKVNVDASVTIDFPGSIAPEVPELPELPELPDQLFQRSDHS